MAEHVWFHEHLAAYCAAGLTGGERQRFEAHAAACPSCALALDELRGFDRALEDLFAPLRPAAGLESRLIEHLRLTPSPRRLRWTGGLRWVGAAAAVLLLAALGAALHTVMQQSGASPALLFAWLDDVTNIPAATSAVPPGSRAQASNHLKQLFLLSDAKETAGENGRKAADSDSDVTYNLEYIRDAYAPNGEIAAPARDGAVWYDLADGSVRSPRLQQLELWDEALKEGREAAEPLTLDFGYQVRVQDTDGLAVNGAAPRLGQAGRSLAASPDGKLLGFGAGSGQAGNQIRDKVVSVRGFADLEGALSGGRTPSNGPVPEAASRTYFTAPANGPARADINSANTIDYFAPSNSLVVKSPSKVAAKTAGVGAIVITNGDTYHRIADEKTPPTSLAGGGIPAAKADNKDEPKDNKAGFRAADAGTVALGGIQVPTQPKTNEPPAPPAAARKIIRTGDIDFEVESFDTAVNTVSKLIGAIPGAFVATVNSEKLPNGKVRGSAVVRIPPERLDAFVLDLRRDLTKAGDLRSQRIGSQDVSKQYTDIESRLRAARTMEERLLAIIKSGKGEIKDLIAAERELGIWRTKLEEMEGEIRYYNNQIGLSTLTIALAEKEIQSAALMIVTQKTNMRIEVEDVEKTHKAALAAVADLKGRVIRSEVKQHAGGQLEAIFQAEIAPENSDKLRDSFKQLGIVTHQDAERTQQAEGGRSKISDGKVKQQDVQFHVTLYNVANIQPRRVYLLQVATTDVPGGFRKLQEAVAQAKGQVRAGQLSEQDKQNISAQFDFDLPTPSAEAIDKVLAEVGDNYSRQTTQAAPSETATDRKVGYRVTLKNAASIPPREEIALNLEVRDVDLTAGKVTDMVRDAEGRLTDSKTTHDEAGRVTSLLAFDVPYKMKDQLVRGFKGLGTVRVSRSVTNPQAPDTRFATAHIIVRVTNIAPIVPTDGGLWAQVRTGLSYSVRLLSFSVMFIILGVAVVLPWALVIWLVIRTVRRWRTQAAV